MSNLLDNALRYTPPEGVITLRGELGPGTVLLSVRDTGPGIDPADLPHVFERFYRADKARSQGQQNTGLGLAIVQQIAQAHGGTASVRSRLGAGTEFTIALPVGGSTPAGDDGRHRTLPLRLPGLHHP